MFLTYTFSLFRLSRIGIRRKHYCVRHMCSKYRHLNTVLNITYTDWSKTSLLEPARHAAIHPHQCLPSHKDHSYTYTHTITSWKYNIQPSSSILKLLGSSISSNFLYNFHFYFKRHGLELLLYAFFIHFLLYVLCWTLHRMTNMEKAISSDVKKRNLV